MGINTEYNAHTGRQVYVAPDGKRFGSLREAELYERQRSTRSAYKTAQFSNAYGAGHSKIDEQLDKLSAEIDRLARTAELVIAERNTLRDENKKLEGELADRDEQMENEFTRLELAVQNMINNNAGLQAQVEAWQEDSEEKDAEITRLQNLLDDIQAIADVDMEFMPVAHAQKKVREVLDKRYGS